jgi:hypothetical protein
MYLHDEFVFRVNGPPAGQLIPGAEAPDTETLNEHVLVFDDPSVAFHVIVVVPLFNCTLASEVPVPVVAPLSV